MNYSIDIERNEKSLHSVNNPEFRSVYTDDFLTIEIKDTKTRFNIFATLAHFLI